MNNFPNRLILLLFILLSPMGTSLAAAPERLDYQVSYKGVLSLFKTLEIGDVSLISQATQQPTAHGVWQYELSASSEAYPLVERLYPYRYHFRSFFDVENRQIRLFEKLQKTRKFKHKLAIFDYSQQLGQLYRTKNESMKFLAKAGATALAANELDQSQLEKAAKPLLNLPEQLLDRLSMLHEIRKQPLKAGQSAVFQVSSGEELIAYRFRVEKKDVVEHAGQKIGAWKIRIDGFENDKEKVKNMADEDQWAGHLQTVSQTTDEPPLRHAPVYLWISSDEKRLPLKFVNRHAVGTFTVRLKS